MPQTNEKNLVFSILNLMTGKMYQIFQWNNYETTDVEVFTW